MNGHIGGDNLLHPLAHGIDIIRGHRTIQAQVYIVAVADGDVDDHRTVGPQVVGSLVQHEEQGARIGSHGRRVVEVEELHFLLLIHAVVHSLNFVVHTCRNGAVLHLESDLRIDFLECRAGRYVIHFAIVATMYLDCLFHSNECL